MSNHRPTLNRIKRRSSYNVREAAKIIGVHVGTIRHWAKNGLHAVEGVYPQFYRGEDLIGFLRARVADRKQPCGPGRQYCFTCKEPKRPAYDEVEFHPDKGALGK